MTTDNWNNYIFLTGAWDPSGTVSSSNNCVCNGLMMAY
jgi:hypothetical protein